MSDLVKEYKTGRWSTEEVAFLIENYENNTSDYLINVLNRKQERIQNKANQLGLHKNKEVWNKLFKDTSERNRKYKINKRYFQNIDTPEKAYWLGFIYADGCISDRNNKQRQGKRFRFALNDKDRHIVESLKECLETDHPIYECRDNKISLEVVCREIYDDLLSHDIVPNKTYNHIFPTNIPHTLLNHYIRGCFDGDGCIYCKPPMIAFMICGNKLFCDWILDKIRLYTNIEGGNTSETSTNNLYECRITGKYQVSAISKWMYNNSTLHLYRKYDIFKNGGLLE